MGPPPPTKSVNHGCATVTDVRTSFGSKKISELIRETLHLAYIWWLRCVPYRHRTAFCLAKTFIWGKRQYSLKLGPLSLLETGQSLAEIYNGIYLQPITCRDIQWYLPAANHLQRHTMVSTCSQSLAETYNGIYLQPITCRDIQWYLPAANYINLKYIIYTNWMEVFPSAIRV